MTQPRLQPGLLDLLHNPVPVARGFQRHRRAWRTPGQVAPHGTGRVRQPDLLHDLPARHVFSFHQAVPLVAVKGDILTHARLLFFPKRDLHRQPTLTGGVALSYIHPNTDSSERFSPAVGLKPGPTFKTAGQRPPLQVTAYDPFRGAALRGSPAPEDSVR